VIPEETCLRKVDTRRVTTAVAMGEALRARLEKAGISFRVLQSG